MSAYTIEPAVMAILVPLYNSPQRHYHDLNHINYSLSKLSEVKNALKLSDINAEALKYAIWFHDAVYSPYKFSDSSNEVESAELFKHCYESGLIKSYAGSDDFYFKVLNAIIETENHDKEFGFSSVVTDIMMDIDMAGFAKPFALSYADSDLIFKEYAFLGYPKESMMQARIDFLQKLLGKEHIYRTEYFRETHEAKARQNIADIIKATKRDLIKLGPF